MGVSKNSGTPKSSILIGFSIVNHPFWGTPILGNTHIHHIQCLDIHQVGDIPKSMVFREKPNNSSDTNILGATELAIISINISRLSLSIHQKLEQGNIQ